MIKRIRYWMADLANLVASPLGIVVLPRSLLREIIESERRVVAEAVDRAEYAEKKIEFYEHDALEQLRGTVG